MSLENGVQVRLHRLRRRGDMEVPPEHLAEEIKRLQRCINDLVGVLALPAIGSRSDPSQIVRTLFDVLLGMLHLDFVYVKLTNAAGDAPIEMLRVAESRTFLARPQEVGEALGRWLGPDPLKWVPQRGNPFDNGEISIVPSPLGLQGEIGIVVAGSSRPDFPAQGEKLLLSVTTNQAAIGLQEARLLGEQKRLANKLDQRVALRTSELAAANDQLRLQVGLLQQIPVAAWTLGPEGTPEFVNQSWLQYTGQSLDYVRSGPEAWMSAIHPDDREGASRSFWDGIRLGQGFTMETRFRREHDGTYRWHLNRAVGLRDAEGKILKFVGTSTDIEDLKQSQENLQKAEEKTRLIIDSTLDAVITIDAHGMITSWNKQAEIVFGWSSREAIGQHMADMIIPVQERMAHERGLRHFLASGEGPILRRRIEVTAVRRSGVEFPVELEIMPVRLGQDWHFNAFIHDITDSKLAAAKLRESELNLRQLTETIPEMLWSATPEGEIDYCNARVLDYTGFTAEEIMGGGWIKLLHPDDVDRTARVWMSCVATGAPYRVEIRTLHAADRKYRWCVTSALPLLDQQGRIVKWHGTIVDMHDWKQAQEELRNTQAQLAHMMRVMTMGELTASIAHEVNQPLSGIITNAGTCLRMLASEPPNVEGARETARRTLRDGNRASDVITRLRALFGKKGETAEAVDLNEATREVIALSLSQLERAQVILRTDLAEDLLPVRGDRIQLQQVILNLVLNASDAMSGVDDRPRQLLIRTAREDQDGVRVSVEDTGVGFEPQNADRLFEAFYTTKSSGMGIGLSVSRSIIENHHGRLWAAPNDGAGATFSFSIPCEADGVPAARSLGAIRTRAMTDGQQIPRNS
jgi:PAS domain S-box-containing protein